MNEIRIGKKIIGLNQPIYIIAEIGSNHDGSIEKAKKLIKKASECGVDAVKFQFFKADTIAANMDDDLVVLENGKTMYQIYKENETPYEWCEELKKYSEKCNVVFLATPFDKKAVDLLDNVNIDAFKIASFEIVDFSLLDYVASKKRPIILSTGMANLDDIDSALEIIKKYHSKYILLHCGIVYPFNIKDCNLNAIKTLKERYKCPVGYSDHTEGLIVPIVGVGLGINIFERHFTLHKDTEGPDHGFASNPEEFRDLVIKIREAESALGSYEKKKVPSEEMHYIRGRRSIFVIKDIKKDSKFTHNNLGNLRPSIGLHPKHLERIIGKTAKKEIKKNTPLSWDLVKE